MSVIEIIKHYQRSLEKCAGNLDRMLHCVTKLYHLPITVQHLQETGVGRTVNGLRKYEGDCGEAAKACVAKWKAMVAADESSDAEPEDQQVPKHTELVNERKHSDEYSPDGEHMETSECVKENKERSQSKKRDNDSVDKKVRTDSINSNGGYKQCREEKSTSSRSREDSSSRRRNVEEAGSDKKRKEHSHSSDDSASKANKRSVEEYASVKHKERTAHTSSRSSDKAESPNSSRSRNKHKDEDSKSSSSRSSHQEATKQKSRDKDSGNLKKKRIRSGVSASEDSLEESFLSFDVPVRVKAKEPNQVDIKLKHPKVESSQASSKSEKHRKSEKRKDCDKKIDKLKKEDGSIDCLSGASFAEALGMVNPVKRTTSPSSSNSYNSPQSCKSSSPNSKPSASANKKLSLGNKKSPAEFDFLSSPSLKLEPSDIDLPAINPNYRPLPNAYNPFESPPQKKVKGLSEEEALTQVMYHRAERTKVYSGVKLANFRCGDPPSLFEICTRVLQDNIDALGYTGGVPYDILEPVLKRATPDQLFELEYHNPYLIEDTDKLWQFHCNKQFRSMSRLEMETYRELFMRGLDERAAKLEALTSNIKQAQATSVPVRKAKLTYMDSVAKPPREVARQQARNGTARPVPRGAPCSSAVSAPVRPISTARQKPRIAPLMQKTMKFARTFKR